MLYSLHGDDRASGNDKLCRVLFFCGALKDAGAGRRHRGVPYLCYSRKDRRTKPNDPITTRYVAAMFDAVGIERVMTVEVHNVAAFENAFRCPTVAHRSRASARSAFRAVSAWRADRRRLARCGRRQAGRGVPEVAETTDRARRRQRLHGEVSQQRRGDRRAAGGRRIRQGRDHHRRPHQHRRHADTRRRGLPPRRCDEGLRGSRARTPHRRCPRLVRHARPRLHHRQRHRPADPRRFLSSGSRPLVVLDTSETIARAISACRDGS